MKYSYLITGVFIFNHKIQRLVKNKNIQLRNIFENKNIAENEK
jgi:hypothetical protein